MIKTCNTLLLTACILLSGCGEGDHGMVKVEFDSEVEIAPGKWLPVQQGDTVHALDLMTNREDPHNLGLVDSLKQRLHNTSTGSAALEQSSLKCEWKGKMVEWNGKEIPITLREFGGELYMIGFNREKQHRHRFVYFSLNQKGTGFTKIKPQEFPRQVATQNMWIDSDWRLIWVGNKRVDRLKELRELDINSPYFDHSLTAYIWYEIENGVPLYKIPRTVDHKFLKKYVDIYHPIPLPTIVKLEPGTIIPNEK